MAEVYTESLVMPIGDLVHNENNPRYIKSKKHRELVKSLQDFPEMKLLREIVIDENNLILAGDKRTYALEEMGYKDVPVKKVYNLSEAKKLEFIAKDNVHSGEWDTDILADQWDLEQLKEWGVPDFTVPGDDKEDKKSTQREVECPNCGEHFTPGSTED